MRLTRTINQNGIKKDSNVRLILMRLWCERNAHAITRAKPETEDRHYHRKQLHHSCDPLIEENVTHSCDKTATASAENSDKGRQNLSIDRFRTNVYGRLQGNAHECYKPADKPGQNCDLAA